MPRMSEDRINSRKRLVEDAAAELFKCKGFHGVGLREIADKAGVSLGNIYNHYASKDAIYESVIARLHARFIAVDQPLAQYLLRTRFPLDLEEFGQAVGHMVDANVDYLTLLYLDVVEFGGRHFRPHYQGLAARFDAVLKPHFDNLRAQGIFPPAVDPAVAFTLVYMQFFSYFIVERLIGATGHLGLDDPQAIKAISALFRHGLERKGNVHPPVGGGTGSQS